MDGVNHCLTIFDSTQGVIIWKKYSSLNRTYYFLISFNLRHNRLQIHSHGTATITVVGNTRYPSTN
jgi:hypothetical protein